MCGIVGSISDEHVKYDILIDTIKHRGPDANDCFIENKLFLGHTRLSIQDISSNGSQPMLSNDGRYVLIFNGEIYNHFELRNELLQDLVFKSTSDTETVLYCIIMHGIEVIKKFNGIFAFAFYDRETKKLEVARDQFGIKPLYFYLFNGALYFGSEIKSFLKFDKFDKTINYRAVLNYISLLWSPGELTPFLHVKKLLPGHYFSLNIDRLETFQVIKYFDIPFNGNYLFNDISSLIPILDETLTKAVERQLLSDVPIAFFLSGGLDSSAILAIAKKIRPNERFRCYTIKTNESLDKEGFSNDLHYAKIVADYLDLDLIEVESEIDILKDFDKMVFHLDEPQADAAPLNVLNICKIAKRDGYKVLIGGTAGDDLFSGYRRHKAISYEKYFKLIPKIFILFFQFIFSFLRINSPLVRRIKKILSTLHLNKIQRFYTYFEWLPLATVKQLFAKDKLAQISNYMPSNYFFELLKNIPNEKSDLNKMLYWELKTFLVDHNLNYTDKLSMATGVEVRVPFLDIELLKLSTKINPNLKLKGQETKFILKKLMEKYLPREVIYRKKAGFGAPVREWIKMDLNDKIEDYLSEASIDKRKIFNSTQVRNLISDNKKGKVDASYSIWSLLAIESWMRQFIDKNNSDLN